VASGLSAASVTTKVTVPDFLESPVTRQNSAKLPAFDEVRVIRLSGSTVAVIVLSTEPPVALMISTVTSIGFLDTFTAVHRAVSAPFKGGKLGGVLITEVAWEDDAVRTEQRHRGEENDAFHRILLIQR
jgi:hypothetical protein